MHPAVRIATLLLIPLALAGAAPAPERAPDCDRFARSCLASLVAEQKHRGWIGAGLGFPGKGRGFSVQSVEPGSPAERGGLQAGDVVLAIDGKDVRRLDAEGWRRHFLDYRPGVPVTYTIRRREVTREVTVTPAALPEGMLVRYVAEQLLFQYPEAFEGE